MDTIVFFRVYHFWEDPKPYIALLNNPYPRGFDVWIRSLKGTKDHICWFKIKCHEQIGYGTATAQDIANLRAVVDSWLTSAGLCLDDFTLSRIDYDYNFYMEHAESDVLLETMQQLSKRIMRMNKWGGIDEPTVYYLCKSRHAQLYCKDTEREDKGFKVSALENGLCRQEVQCHTGRIKYMKREYGLVRSWGNWVTPEMEAEYLTTAEPVFLSGDFYSMERAVDIIQASGLTPCHKKRLTEMLAVIQNGTMDALKGYASRNTIKKYLAMLKDLNVNPLTIKTDFESNLFGITYIANPFFKRKGI